MLKQFNDIWLPAKVFNLLLLVILYIAVFKLIVYIIYATIVDVVLALLTNVP